MKKLTGIICLVLLAACADEPEPCTVEQDADGSATITCPDGSTATVEAPPKDACTITEMDGKKVLQCGDDTAVLAENGTCDTLVGGYNAYNTLDAKRFGEYGCTKIDGNLQLTAIDSCDDFASLEHITGAFTIGATKLDSLDCFKKLKTVGGDMSINTNPNLTECEATALHDGLESKPNSFQNQGNKPCN